MKIALVHDFMTKIGGAEKVLLSLCDLYPDIPIYTLLYDEAGTKGLFKDKKVIVSGLNKLPSMFRKPKLLLSKYPEAIEQFDLSEYDIVISSSGAFSHGVLTKPKTTHFCYCHSPMRYAWDWHHEYLAENKIGFGLKGLYVRNLIHNIRIWDRVSADRVDFWIANSTNVAARIKKYYQKDSTVIFPPIATESIPFSDQKEDFFIIISRLEPYKKIELAVKTFNKNGKRLVIVGSGSQEEHLKSIAKENIEFLGWQTDEKKYDKLSKAKALIFPGEDDFGIVPVESLAAGTPVIAFKKGGALETIQENETGVFFEEESAESLAGAIEKFETIQFDHTKLRSASEKYSEEKFKESFKNFIESKTRK